jgi:hypothetical protein
MNATRLPKNVVGKNLGRRWEVAQGIVPSVPLTAELSVTVSRIAPGRSLATARPTLTDVLGRRDSASWLSATLRSSDSKNLQICQYEIQSVIRAIGAGLIADPFRATHSLPVDTSVGLGSRRPWCSPFLSAKRAGTSSFHSLHRAALLVNRETSEVQTSKPEVGLCEFGQKRTTRRIR